MKLTDRFSARLAHLRRLRGEARARGLLGFVGKIPRRLRWIAAALPVVAAGGLLYYSLAFQPSQTSDEPALQTATARQGSLVISASGSGTLIARQEVDLAFETEGEITDVPVVVGDHVEKGKVLATVDDTDARLQVTQARRAVQELTSASAIATAKADIATAQANLDSAKGHLAYIISPNVYYWEQQVEEREAALAEAESAAATSPDDGALQHAVTAAQDSLDAARESLGGAQYTYENTYLRNTFKVTKKVLSTGRIVTYIAKPSEADILSARADVAEAQAALVEANDYHAALTGADLPPDATGANLTALDQARLDLEAAEDELDGCRVVATISGTVMSVDVAVGETASVGTTVITVSDLDHPYLEVFLDESDWGIIKVGADAEVTFDILPDDQFTGSVTQVDPALYSESGSSVVRAYVELADVDPAAFNLPLGTAASVEVIGARAENAVLVPVEALHKTEGGQVAVFVLTDGEPRLRLVEVGIQDLLYAEVKSGLQTGDVVTTGIVDTQ